MRGGPGEGVRGEDRWSPEHNVPAECLGIDVVALGPGLVARFRRMCAGPETKRRNGRAVSTAKSAEYRALWSRLVEHHVL